MLLWLLLRELEQMRFWASQLNRKLDLFLFRIFNMLWRHQICPAKCLYSYRDGLPENSGKSIAQEFNNFLYKQMALKNGFA